MTSATHAGRTGAHFANEKTTAWRLDPWLLAGAILGALGLMLATHVVFPSTLGAATLAGLDTNYFKPFTPLDLAFILAVPVCYGILMLLDRLVGWAAGRPAASAAWNRRTFMVVAALVLIVAWLPYYFSFYPGNIFADVLAEVSYVDNEVVLSNQQPLVCNLMIAALVNGCRALGVDLTYGVGALLAVQMLAVIGVLTYMLGWLMRRGVGRAALVASLAFLAFCPVAPLLATNIVKDVPHSMALMVFSLQVFDLHASRREERVRPATLALYVLSGLVVAFTRNNGVYILAGMAVLYPLLTWRSYATRRAWATVTATAVALTLAVLLIQGPGYQAIGIVKSPFRESVGIPLQQLVYVAATDGLTPEQEVTFDKVIDTGIAVQNYAPCSADTVKYHAAFDDFYLNDHKKEFLGLYLEVGLEHPVGYLKAYLMETCGFWSPWLANLDGNIQYGVWPNSYGIRQLDLMEAALGTSLFILIDPYAFVWPAGPFIWLAACGLFLTLRRKGIQGCVGYLPSLGLWGTMMIATPIAVSLRYVLVFVFGLPLFLLLPLVAAKSDD